MLTVVIATHNGARTLPRVLEAHCALVAPPGGWKLVIVDNASTDGTRGLIESYAERLPLSYVHEARKGQNWARLAAMSHLEGDLAVFSDDDTRPEPNWLVTFRALAEELPEYDLFGSEIVPEWESPPPQWVLEWVDLGVCYAATDPSQGEGPILPNLIWSPSMAFRRRIFDLGHSFDPAVGPAGQSYAMGSETDFNVRLGEAGFKAWFTRRTRVHHFVRTSQFDRQWILGRAGRFGRGMYRRALLREANPPKLLFDAPRYLYRQLAGQCVAYALASLRGGRARFQAHWDLNYLLGCLTQAREHYRAR
jgi:L-malate glycosyltransferase